MPGPDPTPDDVTAAWEANAGAWVRWTRTPGIDVHYSDLNLPAFAALLPPAGRRTLDVGCGEGRLGRWLAERGHAVCGIDASPTLARHAEAAGGYEEVVCGDAGTMPWAPGTFDLAVAFMSLHDMPDPRAAIAETARVLAAGSAFCIAIVHPLNRGTARLSDYFSEHVVSDTVTRDDVAMTFTGVDRPLEHYTRALAESGFALEELREPRPSPEAVARAPALASAAQRPFFLHLRARLRAIPDARPRSGAVLRVGMRGC